MAVLQGSVYVADLVGDSDLSSATVVCTVTAPDGTVAPYTPTFSAGDSTKPTIKNVATVAILAAQLGDHLVVWGASGGVIGAQQDQFTVEAPSLNFMSLPDLKDRLHLKATDSSKDAYLRECLRAATGVVENITGPILPRTMVEHFDGGQTSIVLSAERVSTVTSVSETYGPIQHVLTEQPLGASVDAYGFTWDRATGVLVRRGAGGSLGRFASGVGNVAVTYRAGFATIPADVARATAVLIGHWFQKDTVAYRSPGPYGAQGGDDTVMVGNYEVPNAVLELLEPLRRMPSIA